MTRPRTRLNRREFLAAGLGTAGVVAAGATLFGGVLPRLAHEDLVPGRAPDLQLTPNDWHVGPGRLSFVALGDNGSGGRQAMAVAEQMARTYLTQPFGLVSLLGDICYYGRFADRFDDVFRRPMEPLIDAEVNFELAIGNHDAALNHSDASIEEIEAELELLGTPGRFYTTSHGPVDFFYLDSSTPGLFGVGASEQLEWLDDALASSTSQWKVVALHHPIYSSGEHGSTPGAQERLQPLLDRRAVDLVLSGHDHHYERAVPADGITYVVSGGGCKTTRVGRSDFTVAAESTLQFVHVEVEDDRLSGTSIRPDGTVVDRFRLRAREGRRGAMA
jgi:3',5'-cyclic AMP phosphodiesterase CpdA